MAQLSNETLTELLQELKTDIKEGFAGVHKRQDKTNGNVISNKSEIENLKRWRAYLSGAFVVASFVLGFVINHVF